MFLSYIRIVYLRENGIFNTDCEKTTFNINITKRISSLQFTIRLLEQFAIRLLNDTTGTWFSRNYFIILR